MAALGIKSMLLLDAAKFRIIYFPFGIWHKVYRLNKVTGRVNVWDTSVENPLSPVAL